MGVESALAAALHPTSMGQLLVMDYNVIKELPADLGMTVRILKYKNPVTIGGKAPVGTTNSCRGCQGYTDTMTVVTTML